MHRPFRSATLLAGWLFLASGALPAAGATDPSPAAGRAGYAMGDFARVRKIDAHVHANTMQSAFLRQARADGFELVSINVDYPDFPAIDIQRRTAEALARRDPARFHWAATFSMHGFPSAAWLERTQAQLARDVAAGAVAVKVWKNVGMVEIDPDGHRVMLDDPRLAPLAAQVQALGVPLIDHQGEPYNCWLPLEQMTTDNDREYFRLHPQYHMYLHPDEPGYEQLMAVRDRFVQAHPGLRFVGAHMASLEYDVDRLGAFLDRFPDAVVDLAARMTQVQYQSLRNRGKVRDFFIRYQDRLLYGSDLTQEPGADPAAFRRDAHAFWTSDWRYLATAETQHVDALHADVPGLDLPRAVIDKLYHDNAARTFGLDGAPRQAAASGQQQLEPQFLAGLADVLGSAGVGDQGVEP